MPRVTPRLIDFHSHYYDAAWYPFPAAQRSRALASSWPLLTDIQAQLAAMDAAGIDAKVLSAPAALFVAPGEQAPPTLVQRINDRFAALVAAYPDRLFALATIDAFQGEDAAREVERAVGTLCMGGICVDCARGDRFLDDPGARPALEAAAALDAVVFVHPVSPVGYTERLACLGHIGVLLARGTENAASVLALLRSGIFDALPDLKVVIPMIGAAALVFAGIADQERGREDGWEGPPPSASRRRLYMDTMGFDPMAVRFAVELLGAEHVVSGSDWPIMPITARRQVEQTLASLNLGDAERAAILGGNAVRLLARQDEPG